MKSDAQGGRAGASAVGLAAGISPSRLVDCPACRQTRMIQVEILFSAEE